MSHDERTARAFDGLVTAMHTNELLGAIEVLARQVVELRGLDFQTDGQQIIDDALVQGHDEYHERINRKSLQMFLKILHPDESEVNLEGGG